ncbi:MAG TPA: Gfo/Idh/MocA family oxidoreductase [Pirellulales bacterium]|nr:Gfo/Idh/MocA family oxidoreductase [Pirellulales bacterium]
MSHADRRAFLKQTGALAALATTAKAANADAITIVTVGVIGTGGMGTNHLRQLAARHDVRLAYVCDVDTERLAAAAKTVESLAGTSPKAVKDLRQVLDDKEVEAVWIATPDHWHAPASLLALEAGKHVYVEKPCCHNVHEGRLMVEAVRRCGKLLQVGTQSRSTECVREAIERIQGGAIGEVLAAKAWNSQRRRTIGKNAPNEPPQQLDFDLWLGPAPEVAYRPNLLPGVWRWWYDFGCGDIGNDGVHDIDVAAWGLGVETHPSRVVCLGGKYFFDDDQQFPDTQYAVFEYESAQKSGRPKQLVFEQRIWSPYVQEGYENGAAFYGTEGLLILGHSVGWKLYGPRNKLIAERSGSADLAAHHQNFLDCIRGRQSHLNAGVEVGHRAAALVHLANIAARVGRQLSFDPAQERIAGDADADRLLRRTYRKHWATPADLG